MEQDEAIRDIARKILGFQSLRMQNSDHLDFRDLPVWLVRDALTQAWAAGYAFRMNEENSTNK